MSQRLEAIIFDMDGTLLDTEQLYWRAWQLSLVEVGVSFPEAFYPTLVGCTWPDCEPRIRDAVSHPELIEVFLEAIPRHYQRIVEADGMWLRPGVRELLDWLAGRKIPLAVATSTGRSTAEHKLRLADIDHCFVSLTAGNEVARGKPAPDIFQESLRRIGKAPDVCLAFEDSPNGLRAAVSAGLRTILIPDLAPVIPEVAELAWRKFTRIDEAIPVLAGLFSE